jgi:hypothetical protein
VVGCNKDWQKKQMSELKKHSCGALKLWWLHYRHWVHMDWTRHAKEWHIWPFSCFTCTSSSIHVLMCVISWCRSIVWGIWQICQHPVHCIGWSRSTDVEM